MDSWLKDWLKFQDEHQVMIVFKRIRSNLLESAEKFLDLHFEYYKELNKENGLVQYGRSSLTGDAIFILLHASSDRQFEEIIRNDPSIGKVYSVETVLAFSNLL